MKLEERMCLSVRRRAGNVVLRADVADLGSQSQVSHALLVLQRKGVLIRMGRGVYAKAYFDAKTEQVKPIADFETLVSETSKKLSGAWRLQPNQPQEAKSDTQSTLIVDTGNRRVSRKLSIGNRAVAYVNDRVRSETAPRKIETGTSGRRHMSLPVVGIARFVRDLARRYDVVYAPTAMDRWAETVTRLAGDEVRTGEVQNLLVALKRAGKVSAEDMATLLINHLRERKQGVRPV